MDWSVLIYFLAAVLAAGASYAVWPKQHRPQLKIVDASLGGGSLAPASQQHD